MIENRPNFFHLLGIDPDDPWSDARLRQVLQEKERIWQSQKTGVAKRAHEAARNLALLSEIAEVMQNPAKRAQEAREARALAQAAPPARPSVERTSPQVDAALLTEVENLLRKTGCLNIYAVFYVSPSESLEVIQRHVESFRRQLAEDTFTDNYVQTLRKLVGYAEIIFRTASNRQRYDESLPGGADGAPKAGETNRMSAPRNPVKAFEQVTREDPPSQKVEKPSALRDKSVEKSEPLPRRDATRPPPAPPQPSTTLDRERAGAPAQPAAVRPAPDDIAGLTLKNLDGALNLKWMWPADCTEALLTYGHFNWPQPGQPDVTQVRVTRAEYEVRGHYELRGPLDRPYFIVVAAVLRKAGVLVVTPGDRIQGYMARKLLVDYEIKNARFGTRQRTLHLYTSVPGRIPTLLLRSCVGHMPLTRDEGVLFQRIEGPLDVHGELTVPLLNEARPDTFGRLFLEDESLYTVITLCKPPERKLSFGR